MPRRSRFSLTCCSPRGRSLCRARRSGGWFLAAAAALSLWRGFTRKGRRIVFLSIAGAAALSALALFAAWSAAAPKMAYEAPETEPKAIFSEKRVLAVVPHEDDDLNLLSGVTGQFTDAGSEVYVVFVSTGDAAGLGEKRVYEAINALSLDGVPEENIIFLGYGDSIPDDGIHIYNAAPNAVTPSLSGRTETYAAPNHEAYREGSAVYARKPARRSAQRDRGNPRRRDLLRGL